MARTPDSLDDLGRFSEPALLILVSLAEGPKHGYAMTLDIEALSGKRLGPGTLYGALARLESRAWIEALAQRDRQRPYRLTRTGRAVLARRLESVRAVADVGRARLGQARLGGAHAG
jgi:DNA-binding PadR family transcriptional regulator